MVDSYNLTDANCIMGKYLATECPITIQLTKQEMDLATMKTGDINASWYSMCCLVLRRTGVEIIDNIHIDSLVVNGNKRKFH